MDSDYLFGNFLQLSAFRSKDKASLTDSFRSPPKQVLGGSPFYQYGSGSGNASPHGHLPLAFSRSAICIQTGRAALARRSAAASLPPLQDPMDPRMNHPALTGAIGLVLSAILDREPRGLRGFIAELACGGGLSG